MPLFVFYLSLIAAWCCYGGALWWWAAANAAVAFLSAAVLGEHRSGRAPGDPPRWAQWTSAANGLASLTLVAAPLW